MIGQRLYTGRVAVAQAALAFRRQVFEVTEAYAKQKPIPDVAGRKGRVLADIPQLRALFADAAKQFSQCPSKGKGGSLGSFRKLGTLLFLPYEGQDVPEFDAAVWSVPVGEVSAVTTSFGVHLLRVDARGSPE